LSWSCGVAVDIFLPSSARPACDYQPTENVAKV
jgi:hypothetical protein